MPSAQLKSNLKAESTIFDPAQHYISFSAVVDSSAPNGAPTFDGRRTLNGNEIAASLGRYLALPTALPFAQGTSKTAADSLKSGTVSQNGDFLPRSVGKYL